MKLSPSPHAVSRTLRQSAGRPGRVSAATRIAAALLALAPARAIAADQMLPGTQPLTMEGDLSAQMVAGIGRFLDRELRESEKGRAARWQPDFGSRAAYEKSVQPNRERLARIVGAVDARVPNPEMQYVATVAVPAQVAETAEFVAYAVRWPVFDGVHGEGLLLQPKGQIVARVVAIPDADQTPEVICGLAPGLVPALQLARRLAENGCQVIVPTLVDRAKTFSGSPILKRYTGQPHREWIYRQAYFLGRHVIGYEVQKVLAAVDWLAGRKEDARAPIGVAGWGEGGLLALYSAALDTRIASVAVSGYFGPREEVWREPIYRNVFGLLAEFGDAEIARLILPRQMQVEHAPVPDVAAVPPAATGPSLVTPGRIVTPSFAAVEGEVKRARQLAGPWAASIRFHHGEQAGTTGPFAEDTLADFLQGLTPEVTRLRPAGPSLTDARPGFDPGERQHRQVNEMTTYTQRLVEETLEVRIRSVGAVNVLTLSFRLTPKTDLTLARWAFGGFCLRMRKEGEVHGPRVRDPPGLRRRFPVAVATRREAES